MDVKPAQDTVAEAVRVSHCAHPYPEKHKCVGTCSIGPRGITLECPECGDGEIHLSQEPGYATLRELLRQINVNISFIDAQTIKDMLVILKGK